MGVNVSLSGVPLQPLAADGCPAEVREVPQLGLNVRLTYKGASSVGL